MAKQTRVVDVRVTSNVGTQMKKGTTQAKGMSGALKGVHGAAMAATGGIRAMTTALLSSGVGAVVVAIGALVGGISSLVNKSRDFDKAFSNLAAVTGRSKDEIASLKENAKQLGATTAFTATQVLELSTEFAKLGFSTTEILNASKATLDLAAAAEVDLAEAAVVAGSTLRGFGLESEETQRVVDVMAKSFTSSALDMEKFKESMKLVAPIAKTTKVSVEESAAALSILADRGVAGSMAGTQLRRVMSDLAQKTGKDFATSLEITADRLNKATSTADKLAIAKELVGDRAKGSLIALAENREELEKLKIAYENAGGAAEEMAEKKLDNLNGSLTKLSSAWDGFMLNLEDGSGVLGKLSKFGVDVLTKSVTSLTNTTTGLGYVWDGFVNFMESIPTRLKVIGLDLEEFTLKARLMAEDIPFWGNDVDAMKLNTQLIAVRDAQAQALEDLAEFKEKGLDLEAKAYLAFNGIKVKEVQDTQDASNAKEKIQDEFIEGSLEKDDAARKKAAEDAAAFREKLKKQLEDGEDIDELSKLQRKKERQLAELEDLKISEDEKGRLRADIEAYWDNEIATKKGEIAMAAYDREQELKKQQAEKDKKDADDKIQLEKDVKSAKMQLASQGLGAIDAITQAFAGKSEKQQRKAFNISKKLRLAQASISAIEGTQNAYTTAQSSPITALFPAYPVIQAGIAAAFGVAQVAQIANTSFQGGGRGRGASNVGGGGSGSGFGAQSQSPSFNVLGSTSAGDQLIASTVAQTNSQPVRAFVVESEMTNAQTIGRNAAGLASVG